MQQFYPRKTYWLLGAFVATAFVVLNLSFRHTTETFHSEEELRALQDGARSPLDSSEYFLGSVACRGCHGYDSTGLANVDENGNDINLYDDWQGTMMAFSAIDPLWRAKVSHEILVNPAHANELQTTCTKCHAPMGHFSAMFKGAQHYTIADLVGDTLGLNGVACGACHQIGPDNTFGLDFSGNLHYDTSRKAYGPFTNPDTGPMDLYVGLKPTYSPHISTSNTCAPCHTLITKTADLNGNSTGGTFVEQATFHEWKNSIYNDTVPCQRCHMPQINDPVKLANGYLNLAPRTPFNLHKFMGGNSTMLKLIRDNRSALGVTTAAAYIDSSITATLDLLQNRTVNMQVRVDSLTTDTLYVSVKLENKAGHKFPSGYPSRRAFVQLAVTNGSDTVFSSGILQPDGEIAGHDAVWEPHYNTITKPNQVQIYEMVMGDVNNNRTTVLERAAVALKDNRIPPKGFTTTHAAYDTVKIIAPATTDADFNRNGSTQGTGIDVVHYHIPVNNAAGLLRVNAGLYYQSVPQRWLNEMFTLNSAPIDSFKTMFNAADKTPVLVAQGYVDSVVVISGIGKTAAEKWRIYPVPTADGKVFIQGEDNSAIKRVEVYTASGKLVQTNNFNTTQNTATILLPETAGIYWLKIYGRAGTTVKKVIRQ